MQIRWQQRVESRWHREKSGETRRDNGLRTLNAPVVSDIAVHKGVDLDRFKRDW
jgi:hypothetical protein